MTESELPRILVVDDEEAILETITFTFMDTYEVLTTSDPRTAMQIMADNEPVAAIITDQRMPHVTGVELLKQVYEKFPETVRIILTGFADSNATIEAINDGHIYAYVNKPWEPDELKQLVKRAVDHHQLSTENRRLLENLSHANFFLEAVMDRLDTGAIAVDREGIVQASNRPAREYLGLVEDPRNVQLGGLLERAGLSELGGAIAGLAQVEEEDGGFEDLSIPGAGHRVRVSAPRLLGPDEELLGRVILFKEISHEPLRREFEELVTVVSNCEGELRSILETALSEITALAAKVSESKINSPSLTQLRERASRTQIAIQNWLDIDDLLAGEEFPDAQVLLDRMNLASRRWPYPDEIPSRVVELNRQVNAYYDSGENPRQRVL